MTCRVFGPPVRSEDGLGVCELCYHGASDEEIAACEMKPDPDDWNLPCSKRLKQVRELAETRSLPFVWHREQSILLFLQLSPAGVKLIHFFLSRFHLCVSIHQARSVADNLGIFKLFALGLQHQLGVGNAQLDGVIFARFQV